MDEHDRNSNTELPRQDGEGPVLRVLLVEDRQSDAELIHRRLRKAGFEVDLERVDDEDGLLAAVRTRDWDVVLADYSLPGFSGLEALRIVSESCLDAPVILVSGKIDVQTALDAVKAGARDFVFKDDLQRLPSIVEREVDDAQRRRDTRRVRAERDRAVQEVQESHERLVLLGNLFLDLPLPRLLDEDWLPDVLNQLLTLLPADAAAVVLLDPNEPECRVGEAASSDPSTRPLPTEFAKIVLAENAAVLVRDARSDPRLAEHAGREDEFRTLLGVPMRSAGMLVGAIELQWLTDYEPPQWMYVLLQMAADNIALKLENVRLYLHEHGIADTLQRGLLAMATELQGVEIGCFYEAATENTLVGGDFYDVFEAGSDRVAVAIGDVSGKGVGAASVAALVRNTFRAYVIDGDSPGLALAKTGDMVHRFTGAETFVTAFIGVLDIPTGRLSFASAGHLPALVMSDQGVRSLPESGLVLGAFADVGYETVDAVLRSGETLVLYTDGVTEARGRDGGFFSEQRLKECLSAMSRVSPGQIASSLRQELREYSGDSLRDDVAVLAVRHDGRASRPLANRGE